MIRYSRPAQAVLAVTPPTARQLEVVRFIAEYNNEHGFGPSIRDIGFCLDIASTNGVNDHLSRLRRKGLLEPASNTARSLVLTKKGREAIGLGEPPGFETARAALLDAATEVASLTNGSDAPTNELANALADLWEANDAWQVVLLRAARGAA